MDNDYNILSETDNFSVIVTDQNNEMAYHIQFGGITLHLNTEEWDELVVLIKDADKS